MQCLEPSSIQCSYQMTQTKVVNTCGMPLLGARGEALDSLLGRVVLTGHSRKGCKLAAARSQNSFASQVLLNSAR